MTLATCWKITRTDGRVFRFTNFSHPLVLDTGEVFTPVGSGSSSARRRESALEEVNAEYITVISDESLSFDDIYAGKFDDAEIREYLVDFNYPWKGALEVVVYYVEDATYTGETWSVQVTSLSSWFRNNIGRVNSRNCWAVLGDKNCRVDLSNSPDPLNTPYLTNGVVDSNPGTSSFVTSSSLKDTTDWYAFGTLYWTTGNNAGLVSEVASHTGGSGAKTVTLFLPPPFEILEDDTFTIVVGCDKLSTTCNDKFDNIVNYRGKNFIPGTDATIAVVQR